jgi:hypothetical protein
VTQKNARVGTLYDQRQALVGLGIVVGPTCSSSSNQLFIPGYLLTLVAAAPATATCADVPGMVDYVLRKSDISAINARMALMNAHMQAVAKANGYAYFGLDAVYALAKPAFRVSDLLFSSNPFGANLSLDSVHPSAAGQGILATAAAKAINAAYGLAIP